MIADTKIASVSLLCSLLAGAAFAADYRLKDGAHLSATDAWEGVGSASGQFVRIDASNTSGFDSGDTFIVDASSVSTSSNLDVGGARLDLLNGTVFTLSRGELREMVLNVADDSKFLVQGGNARINNDFILNYSSNAVSASSGTLVVKRCVVNLENGRLQVGNLTSRKGAKINLNGGDLSFGEFSFGVSPKRGSINFISGAGSTLTFTGASSAADLDEFITNGFISVDGVQKPIETFSRRYQDGTLTLTLAASYVGIPEPSSFGLYASLAALSVAALRRRPPPCRQILGSGNTIYET